MPSCKTKPLLAILAAFSLALVVICAAPAICQAGDDATSSVHVYPGAQPINIKRSGNATSPAQSQELSGQPESSSASRTNTPGVEETGGSQQQSQAETAPDQGSSDVSVFDSQDQAAEEQAARLQTQAAQHYQLGANYFGKWQLDLAEVEFDETVSLCPQFTVAHRDLCLLSLAKLNFPRSLAEFMMVTGITDPIAFSASEKAQLDARAMRLHYRQALAWGANATWNEAITELLWAKTYAPENAAIHHSLAFAYASSGDFQKAEEEYKLTFGEAPADGFAHADFANLLIDKGQLSKAENEMRKAVELSPSAAALHVDLGWIAEAHNDYETAKKEFQTAVNLSPKHAGLWTHLGRLLERQGQLAEAQRAYAQALALDAQRQDARASLERLKQQKPS